MFPGYGFSNLQLSKAVALFAIEVPQMDEDRWVTLLLRGEHWLVVDDFLWPLSRGQISAAEASDGHLRYYDRNGSLLRDVLESCRRTLS